MCRDKASDAGLVQEFLNGDPKAMNELVSRYHGLLAAYLRSWCHVWNPEDALDVCQNVW
jgi:hypothetical protein